MNTRQINILVATGGLILGLALYVYRSQLPTTASSAVASEGVAPAAGAVPAASAPTPAKETVEDQNKTKTIIFTLSDGSKLNDLLNEPTATFKAFATPPVRKLVQLPGIGEVVEITYANGGVLYDLNRAQLDLRDGTWLPKASSPQEEAEHG